MHANILFVSEDTQTVLWQCDTCLTQVRFVKEGFGEPSANSSTPPLEQFNNATSGQKVEGGQCGL